MIFFVVLVNLCITLINFYLVIKIWQLRNFLKRTTATLIKCDRSIHNILTAAPQFILQGKKNISNWQLRYQLIEQQWQQIRQILILLNWLYQLRRRGVGSRE
jgi:hypothetical protein